MKIGLTIIFTIIFIRLSGQITQLTSGTTVNLYQVFVTEQNILIGGITNNYLVKSYDQCNNFTILSPPAPTLYYNYYQRLDTNNIFLMSNGNGSILYRSYDGGASWVTRWTTGYAPSRMVFFDSLEGITDHGYGNTLLRTLDGGINWSSTVTPFPLNPNAITYMEGYGDSTMIIGNYAQFYISKDRGHTWPIAWGCTAPFIDFCFINHDTIFGVTSTNNFGEAYITKTTNGGSTWQNTFAPIPDCRSIVFRTKTEGYVIGTDFSNKAVIAKTTDMGQTWSRFNLGITGELLQMAFLNDSIAIITGTQGLLLRWNFKSALYTGIFEDTIDDMLLGVSPNPTRDKINVKLSTNKPETQAVVSNSLGQIIQAMMVQANEISFDLSSAPAGIYFLKLSNSKGQKTMKIVKE